MSLYDYSEWVLDTRYLEWKLESLDIGLEPFCVELLKYEPAALIRFEFTPKSL